MQSADITREVYHRSYAFILLFRFIPFLKVVWVKESQELKSDHPYYKWETAEESLADSPWCKGTFLLRRICLRPWGKKLLDGFMVRFGEEYVTEYYSAGLWAKEFKRLTMMYRYRRPITVAEAT